MNTGLARSVAWMTLIEKTRMSGDTAERLMTRADMNGRATDPRVIVNKQADGTFDLMYC
jgi:hypothetical protein